MKELFDELNTREILIPDIVIITWILERMNGSFSSYVTNITQTLRVDASRYDQISDDLKGHGYDRLETDRCILRHLIKPTDAARPCRILHGWPSSHNSWVPARDFAQQDIIGEFRAQQELLATRITRTRKQRAGPRRVRASAARGEILVTHGTSLADVHADLPRALPRQPPFFGG